jgi:solute carrier family 25 (mitochondrial uncoupling protein), member 8/9
MDRFECSQFEWLSGGRPNATVIRFGVDHQSVSCCCFVCFESYKSLCTAVRYMNHNSHSPTKHHHGHHNRDHHVAKNIMAAAIATSTATLVSNPFDVIKVRMQLQPLACSSNSVGATTHRFNSALGTIRQVISTEGVGALYKGTTAALARAAVYGSLRLGLYNSILHHLQYSALSRAFIHNSPTPIGSGGTNACPKQMQLDRDGAKATATLSLMAGLISGAFAAAIANPLELIKVRMQATKGVDRIGAWQTTLAVVKNEGLSRLLLSGLMPHVTRGAINTAAQVGTYDYLRNRLIHSHTYQQLRTRLLNASPSSSSSSSSLPPPPPSTPSVSSTTPLSAWQQTSEALLVSVVCSLASGVVTTTATAPIDILKTTIMNSQGVHGINSMLACARMILATDGVLGFFKGWLPSYYRIAPHTTVMFVMYEVAQQALA